MTKAECKMRFENEIVDMILANRGMLYKDIAKIFGVGPNYVSALALSRKIVRGRGPNMLARTKEN